jgi:hypothetical protein
MITVSYVEQIELLPGGTEQAPGPAEDRAEPGGAIAL